MNSLYTSTVREYVESFSLFSIHHIFYANATSSNPLCIDLSIFDIVVTHYSIRLSFDWHLSSFYRQALKEYKGLKVSFVQDEYDETETIRRSIEELGINILFTCVPEEFIEDIYPSSRFTGVKFIQTLTGWIPSNLENRTEFKPISERQNVISYRGRPLAYWYGDLGQEKVTIGKVVKAECEKRGISVDIEWDEDKRIYGDKWYTFLSNAKATLGTESGSNVFDDYGEIRRNIKWEIDKNPAVTYEEIHQKYLVEHEGKVKMNQISPKMFEAIALKTALVLFEGEYSGVLKPYLHYIPLKKDFSNLEEVLSRLQDDSFLKELADKAFQDILLSGKYNYKQFIHQFDTLVAQHNIQSKQVSTLSIQQAFAVALSVDRLKINELENYILAVQSSKFWKLRETWMKLKRKLYLLLQG